MILTFLDSVLYITYFLLLFLSIFWVLVLFSSEQKKSKQLQETPFFSVIVPAFNEEKNIKKTVQSILNLDYPSEKIEIVIVNDGSTDNTQTIIEHFIVANSNRNITLLNQSNHGKGNAMNKGLEVIKGEFFACLDADSFASPDVLQIMLPEFADPEVAAVCPLMKVQRPASILQKVQWSEYIINMFYRFLNAQIHCVHVTPGPFSVYRTEVIKKLGGYDENTITEDLEIAIRLQKHHYKILQTFDAVVETVAPDSWLKLFRQRVRWYKGSVDNSITYRGLFFNKKYGDFGMLRMPTIIASGVIGIVLTTALAQSALKSIYQYFFYLQSVNFDILTLIRTYTPNINLLGLPFFKMAVAGTLISLSFFMMYHSFKLVKEKITNYGRTWLSLVTYLLVYSLFLTTVWIYIAYMFVRGKKNFWD